MVIKRHVLDDDDDDGDPIVGSLIIQLVTIV